jgi:2-deoxystreptamine N-acetyl-D-glucosaminyltransferase/2-deoxystreptamine glucosyltransferase
MITGAASACTPDGFRDLRGLRVLRLTPFFHHSNVGAWPAQYDPVGGQQTQCMAQSLWLAQKGVEQVVVTLGFPGVPDDYLLRPGLRIRRARYRVPEWRSRTTGLIGLTPNWYWATRSICRSMRRQGGWRPDLVHIHGDGQIEALALVPWARRLFACPVVLTVHCSRLANYQPMSLRDRLRHSRVQAAERRAVAAADRVICLNPHTRRIIADSVPFAAEKVHALPDVIDIEDFRRAAQGPLARSARSQFAFDGRVGVAFVGRIAHEKGWRDVVRLMSEADAQDWRVLFVGDGPQRRDLEAALKAAGLQRRSRVTGFLPREAVAGLIAASDVVVMPSVHEEFGGVAVEAMALGVPVAGYAVGGLRLTVGAVDDRLLVAPGDFRALLGVVAAAMAREPWILQAAQRAVDVVRQTCEIASVMQRLLVLYVQLARAHRAAANAADGANNVSP